MAPGGVRLAERRGDVSLLRDVGARSELDTRYERESFFEMTYPTNHGTIPRIHGRNFVEFALHRMSDPDE